MFVVAACGDPIVGTWERDGASDETRGELVLEDDATGEYEVELRDEQGRIESSIRWDVEWSDLGDSRQCVNQTLVDPDSPDEAASAMEFILEGLHLSNKLNRQVEDKNCTSRQ